MLESKVLPLREVCFFGCWAGNQSDTVLYQDSWACLVNRGANFYLSIYLSNELAFLADPKARSDCRLPSLQLVHFH